MIRARIVRPLLPALALLLAASGCRDNGEFAVVGTLEWDRIELTAEAAEPIERIEVREGERVTAGQVILRQDTRRLQAQTDQADALLAQQEARLAELRRGPRTELITQARAQLEGAEGTLASARHELDRVRPLVDKNLLSPQDLDRARAAHDSALAARDAAKAVLAERVHGTTAEELDQARAARDAAAAAARALRVSLERLTVQAPADGLIDDLPLEPGERPQAGAVVAVLLAGKAPYARVYLPEPLRAEVHMGSAATVQVDGIDQAFRGRVRRISADPAFTPYYSLTAHDRSRLSYLTEVELEDAAAHGLPAGIPLQVTFDARPAGE
ncbi:MAG: HlyD family efflux transporter periplasmic adaptor subunit [Pseudomonadota bacterium]